MEIFDKPNKLNGAELKNELADAGIFVTEIYDFADGTIGFDTDEADKAAKIVAKHIGNVVAPEPTIDEKLASVGLKIDDLKAALGL